MSITFGEEQMRAVVTKALIEGMGEEQKTLVIQQAVASLLAQPERSGYSSDKRNRLQVAFDDAAGFAVQKLAREELEKPEHRESIRALLAEVVAKVFEGEGRALIRDSIASALSDAIVERRR